MLDRERERERERIKFENVWNSDKYLWPKRDDTLPSQHLLSPPRGHHLFSYHTGVYEWLLLLSSPLLVADVFKAFSLPGSTYQLHQLLDHFVIKLNPHKKV